MNLHNGSLYWPRTFPNIPDYPALTDDETCDILLIGGGMSGALNAYILSEKTNLDVVLIDRRKAAHGSSSANTGLLQYSSDKMLHEFIRDIGEKDAVTFYQLCKNAVQQLIETASSLPISPPLRPKKSLYFASTDEDKIKLAKEYRALTEHGFPVSFLSPAEIQGKFPFSKPCALLTSGDADVNPYRFVHGLLQAASKNGVRIYEETALLHKSRGSDYFICDTGHGIIRAKALVFATGYENDFLAQQFGASINRSYAIATAPLPSLDGWYDECMIWETKRPYLYMRTTEDKRIIAGGLDEDSMEAELDDSVIENRAERLLEKIKEHFPHFQPTVEHAWCATFGESHDGMPYIGEHPNQPGEFYCLGFGGNGTVYSMLGAEIIKEKLIGNTHPGERLFSLNRVV